METYFSPKLATEILLAEKTMPALDDPQFQDWSEYLFSAPRELRLQVAEILLRHHRQHPFACGLFLAAVYLIAERCARRLVGKFCFRNADLRFGDFVQESMYTVAIRWRPISLNSEVQS